MSQFKTLAILLASVAAFTMGSEDCESDPPTTVPDGELIVEVTNADILELIPITTVTMRPDGADSDSTTFASSLSVTNEDGDTLFLLDALDYLLTEFHITSVSLTCIDGTLLSLESFSTCSGATAVERQSRVLYLTGSLTGGVLLDTDDLSQPILTLKMVEEGTGATLLPGIENKPGDKNRDPALDDGDIRPFDRTSPAAPEEDRTYVRDMGMHW